MTVERGDKRYFELEHGWGILDQVFEILVDRGQDPRVVFDVLSADPDGSASMLMSVVDEFEYDCREAELQNARQETLLAERRASKQ